MRILDIRERTVPIGSAMRNAAIAFDSMTASSLVIRTDTHVGNAFDSIGRYGKGALLHCERIGGVAANRATFRRS